MIYLNSDSTWLVVDNKDLDSKNYNNDKFKKFYILRGRPNSSCLCVVDISKFKHVKEIIIDSGLYVNAEPDNNHVLDLVHLSIDDLNLVNPSVNLLLNARKIIIYSQNWNTLQTWLKYLQYYEGPIYIKSNYRKPILENKHKGKLFWISSIPVGQEEILIPPYIRSGKSAKN